MVQALAARTSPDRASSVGHAPPWIDGLRGSIGSVRIVGLTLLLLAASCGQADPARPASPDHVVTFSPTGAVLNVRVADTDAERSEGLMGVEALPADEGMAFVWDEPVGTTFWMKDTLIPLSIAFVSEGGAILTIRDMDPCVADPCPTYAADGPFVMAIEANRGFFDDEGIAEGDRARLGVDGA